MDRRKEESFKRQRITVLLTFCNLKGCKLPFCRFMCMPELESIITKKPKNFRYTQFLIVVLLGKVFNIYITFLFVLLHMFSYYFNIFLNKVVYLII